MKYTDYTCLAKQCDFKAAATCTKGEVLMKSHKGKKLWVCERCLTFTHNNKQCPTCGYTHLSEMKICTYTGKNKQKTGVKIG